MGRPPRDPVLRQALEVRAATRAAYQDSLEAQVAAAEHACRGRLLGPRAPEWARAEDLWLRNRATAYAWATEELRDHWRTVRRETWAEFQHAIHRGDHRAVLDHEWGPATRADWW